MASQKQAHVARTLYYRDYKTKAVVNFFPKEQIKKFELFWTPRDEEWDEHYLCTYEAPELYTMTSTFEGEKGDDGRVRILFRIHFSTLRPTVPRPDFQVELVLLPVEREDGGLHLAVTSAGSHCEKKYEDQAFVKKELDRLISVIENN